MEAKVAGGERPNFEGPGEGEGKDLEIREQFDPDAERNVGGVVLAVVESVRLGAGEEQRSGC